MANLALYLPLLIPKKINVANMFWQNGATISGNVCMGLYNEAGTRLQQTTIVAHAGASAIQAPSITAFDLPRGRYWLGIAFSSATATIRGFGTSAVGADANKWCAIGEEALGSTQIPTTMTPVASARNVFLPFIGITRN